MRTVAYFWKAWSADCEASVSLFGTWGIVKGQHLTAERLAFLELPGIRLDHEPACYARIFQTANIAGRQCGAKDAQGNGRGGL